MGAYIIYIVLFAGIFGFIFHKKLPNAKAKSLLGMIIFSFLTEFVGKNIHGWWGIKNDIIFNIYILVSFNYYIYLLNTLLKRSVNKKLSNVFFFFFNLVFVVDIVYLQKLFEETVTYAFSAGVIFIVILSCLYLVEVFNSNRVMNFKKSIYFWIVLGILLFYIPILPLMIAVKLVTKIDVNTLFKTALFVLNLLMYGCFIGGFLWSQKKYNY